ncbi:MAG: alginate export family protein, partial [Gemmataceae bacterium]|nr:alginate export family protein [Gemmataceae bacterium]
VHWDIFWRQSREDGIYGNAANLVLGGGGSRARFIGQHAALESAWSLGRHLTLELYYLHFFAGPFLRESGAGQDVDYVSAWVSFLY